MDRSAPQLQSALDLALHEKRQLASQLAVTQAALTEAGSGQVCAAVCVSNQTHVDKRTLGLPEEKTSYLQTGTLSRVPF